MTVISMMSFGDSGAAVADEQSSSYYRKYDVTQKLKIFDSSVIYGGSGSSDLIKEFHDAIEDDIREVHEKRMGELSPQRVYDIARNDFIRLRNQRKSMFLQDEFGLSLDELQTGFKKGGKKIDDEYKRRALEALKTDPSLNRNQYLEVVLGGVQNGKFDLYFIGAPAQDSKRIPRPYVSIGSGSDGADKVLSKYTEGLPRAIRERIPAEEGLVKLIEATNSATNLNVGVGGNPSIVYIEKDGTVRIPNESQCILASELVKWFVNDLLEKDFVYQSVMRLVGKNADFSTIEEEVKRNAKDWGKLDRLIRGYKE